MALRPRRLAAIALATLGAGVVAAPPAVATAAPSVPKGFFGALLDGPALTSTGIRTNETRALQSARVRDLRIAFSWEGLEPAQGTFDFSAYDRVVLDAAAKRLDVLPVVLRAPAWARADAANPNSRPSSPELMQPVLAALVARYGPNGTLWTEHPEVTKTAITRWQVWNEPDTTIYWDDGDRWPTGYTALLKASYATLRQADPSAEVVAAGLTNESWIHMRRLLRAGAGRYMDAAAVHAFSGTVSGVTRILRRNRAALDARGLRSKPLLATEITWSSVGARKDFPKVCRAGWESDEAGQARRISQLLTALADDRRDLRLEGVFYSSWLSPAAGGKGCFDYNGLRKIAAGRAVAKPALRAWTSTVRRLER